MAATEAETLMKADFKIFGALSLLLARKKNSGALELFLIYSRSRTSPSEKDSSASSVSKGRKEGLLSSENLEPSLLRWRERRVRYTASLSSFS